MVPTGIQSSTELRIDCVCVCVSVMFEAFTPQVRIVNASKTDQQHLSLDGFADIGGKEVGDELK